jgi:hypothetical protein
MSRNTKILLAVLAGLLGLCACTVVGVVTIGGVLFNRVASVEPARVEQVAVRVGGPELAGPEFAGMAPEWAFDLLGIQAVGYRAGSNHLILARVPETFSMDVEELQRQMRQAIGDHEGYQWYHTKMQIVGTQKVQVGDQDVDVTIAEGESGSGPYRQVSGLYESPEGHTFFAIGGPIATWDQREVDAMIGALR